MGLRTDLHQGPAYPPADLERDLPPGAELGQSVLPLREQGSPPGPLRTHPRVYLTKIRSRWFITSQILKLELRAQPLEESISRPLAAVLYHLAVRLHQVYSGVAPHLERFADRVLGCAVHLADRHLLALGEALGQLLPGLCHVDAVAAPGGEKLNEPGLGKGFSLGEVGNFQASLLEEVGFRERDNFL
jgi:hypothetical protein